MYGGAAGGRRGWAGEAVNGGGYPASPSLPSSWSGFLFFFFLLRFPPHNSAVSPRRDPPLMSLPDSGLLIFLYLYPFLDEIMLNIFVCQLLLRFFILKDLAGNVAGLVNLPLLPFDVLVRTSKLADEKIDFYCL